MLDFGVGALKSERDEFMFAMALPPPIEGREGAAAFPRYKLDDDMFLDYPLASFLR